MSSSDVAGTMFLFGDPDDTIPSRRKWWQQFKFSCGRLSYLCHRENPEEKRKALVQKNGSYRIYSAGLSEYKRRFLADLYITLIDLEWRYALAILLNAFLVSFLLFAVFWWLMAYNNGDFDNLHNPDHQFCLLGIHSFPDALLFSIETQTTIGYGMAYPNAECSGTLPIVYFQVVVGFILETFLLGLIFVKVARPKYRANTILFSRHAVINQHNGQLVLQVRVGDLRKSHLVDATISAMLVRRYSSQEGTYYPLYQFRCDFQANGMGDRVFLLWPVILTHVIDATSPLYDVWPDHLTSDKFELILYLSGTVESTGEVCQARTSYLPKEILWGHKFDRIEEFDIAHRRWHIDFAGFDDVIYCQDIRQSARDLDHRRQKPETDNLPASSKGACPEEGFTSLAELQREHTEMTTMSVYDNTQLSSTKKTIHPDTKV